MVPPTCLSQLIFKMKCSMRTDSVKLGEGLVKCKHSTKLGGGVWNSEMVAPASYGFTGASEGNIRFLELEFFDLSFLFIELH